jgi:hypothetical protein
VAEVQCADGDCFRFQVKDETKTLHLIPVTFTAGNNPGDVTETLRIQTDLAVGGTITCQCKATVKASEAASAPATATTVLKPAE